MQPPDQHNDGPVRPPSGGLASRIVRAVGAQMASQGLRVVQQILLVPFFLKAWGIEIYTDWLLINAGVAFLAIFDGGMQPYFSGLLQERLVLGDVARYRRAGRIATFNYLAIILVAVAVIGAASLAVDWLALLGVNHLSQAEAYSTMALLAANTLVALPFGVANAVYRAHGEYDRGVMMGTGYLAAQIAIPLVLLLMGEPITMLAAGTVVGTLISWVVVLIDQKTRYGSLPWGLAIPTMAEQRITAAKCLYFVSQPITTWLIFQGPLLILGHLSGPVETVAFNTARTLIGLSRQITLQMAYPFGFELSVLLIRDELAGLRRLLENALSIVAIVGGLLAGATVAAAAPITMLWLRGRIEIPQALILAMAIPIALSAASQLYPLILSFANRPRLIAHTVGLQALIALAFAAMLAPRFGAWGVAAGLGIGEVVAMVAYLPNRTLRTIGIDRTPQAPGIVRAILATILGYGVGRIVLAVIIPSDYPRLAVFAGLWAVIAGLGAFFLLLNAEQRAVISAKVSRFRAGYRLPAYSRK
jgi:O-antigen/teichoic acid export membrane protein